MAAFGISYEGLTRSDIRHIYSYRSPRIYVPGPRPFGRSKELAPRPLIERYPPRFYDYYPTFNMGLPRAPAFNRLPAESIREMVERMRQPIACQRGQEPKSECRSKDHARSRRKAVKAVRFQSPTQDGDVENVDSDKPTDTEKPAEVKDKGEKKEVKDGSNVKDGSSKDGAPVKVERSSKDSSSDKRSKLPDLTDKKTAQKPKKQTSRQERKAGAKLTLPPINN